MKVLSVILFVIVIVAHCKNINVEDVIEMQNDTLFGYHTKFGIRLADNIRVAEAQTQSSKIAGGSASRPGEFPYQVGLIIDLQGSSQSVCGGSILTAWRVLTAAHCWWDGLNQAWRFTVVAGSNTLFSGGQRLQTTSVVVHSGWSPILIRDDIAMINLYSPLVFSSTVAPVALPSGTQLGELFLGEIATASGFGRTADDASGDITVSQYLSHVTMPVITNIECARTFMVVNNNHICTVGAGRSICSGDTGGPLVVTRGGVRVLIGVTTFGAARGCLYNVPSVFVRVTSYISWIGTHI